MFSDYHFALNGEIQEILANVAVPSVWEVRNILEQSKISALSLLELARLLEIGTHAETEKQFSLIRAFVYANFRTAKNELRHIAPIYLSSYCAERCKYCNYSSERKDVERARLTTEDLGKELDAVLAAGNNVIEFTLATDASFTPEKLSEFIYKTKCRLGKTKGSGILLCSDYFSEEQYLLLKKAGLWGMVQWDETLDKEMYEKWHKGSPRKFAFNERIDNHDRAIRAGLEVATGCLFGLSDYRYDVLMQIAKARYLEQAYGVKPFVFGTPRLKAIGGRALRTANEVNDRQYELSLMVYKIAEPGIARWLQTRETLELNSRAIVHGDVYTYNCGDVKPGGYNVNVKKISSCKGGQFGVNELTKERFEERLQGMNFKVDYSWIMAPYTPV